MNNTILKTPSGFEVLKDRPVLILKRPEGMTAEAINQLTDEIQKALKQGGPLMIHKPSPEMKQDFSDWSKLSAAQAAINRNPEAKAIQNKLKPFDWLEKPEALHYLTSAGTFREDQKTPAPSLLEGIKGVYKKNPGWPAEPSQPIDESQILKAFEDLGGDVFQFDEEKMRDQIRKGTRRLWIEEATWHNRKDFEDLNDRNFKDLYLGTWHPTQTPADTWNSPGKYAHVISCKDQRNPQTNSADPGTTNAGKRDNVTPKEFEPLKPLRNRGEKPKKNQRRADRIEAIKALKKSLGME